MALCRRESCLGTVAAHDHLSGLTEALAFTEALALIMSNTSRFLRHLSAETIPLGLKSFYEKEKKRRKTENVAFQKLK